MRNAQNTVAIPKPFRIDNAFRDPLRRALFGMLASPLERTLGLAELNEMYADVRTRMDDDRSFLDKALAILNVRYHVSPEDVARIPKQGPLIVVSNHPFGGLDGVILGALLHAVRPDTKVMANYLLGRIPELQPYMIFVDPFGGPDAARWNMQAMRSSIAHVRSGGLLTIFPAGEVSSINLQKRAVMDPAWSDTVARIVRKTEAPVLPVFFDGANSALFNLMGLIHPLLRTAMLPRELINKKSTTARVLIGNVIPWKKLATFESAEDTTAYLRLRTYILQSRAKPQTAQAALGSPLRAAPKPDPIMPARDPQLLAQELAALPAATRLLTHGEMEVYAAHAYQIPHVLHEIGRQREITFRGVAEGTGKAIDLDRFDEYYMHLFAWNREKNELIGAYRLGPSDEILPKYGVAGLYTTTCFQYNARLLEQVGTALELGRSFVRPEYQRSYSPLLLLWKGIGAFVSANPRYQVLFGPVSINAEYQSLSQQLIMHFLKANNADPAAQLVKAKNPPHVRPPKHVDLKETSTVVRDIDEVSDLIAEIEADQKGIPILLKQYLKLGGKILGFNIDPDFGNVLDGLILVDLRQTDARLIERFAGVEGARRISAWGKAHPANESRLGK